VSLTCFNCKYLIEKNTFVKVDEYPCGKEIYRKETTNVCSQPTRVFVGRNCMAFEALDPAIAKSDEVAA